MAISAAGRTKPAHRTIPQVSLAPRKRMGRVIGGNRVKNTFSDREALDGLVADFDKATSKIQFETFLFNGEDGQKVADTLIRAHKRGVKVQVLLDRIAQARDHHVLENKLKDAGIDVRTYSSSALRRLYSVEHAKLAIVDDGIAWSGGVNFDEEINRDMMSRVEGPAVSRFQRTFHEGWKLSGGEILPVHSHPKAKGSVRIRVAQTSATERTTRAQVLKQLAGTRKGDRVDLWMMDLGDHTVLDGLLAANARGVEVRPLLDIKTPFAHAGLLGRIQDWLMKGAPDLYAIKRLVEAGIEVRTYVPPPGITKLHSKVWIFTRRVGTPKQARSVIGGSVNALKSAYDFNHELGFTMSGPGVGSDVVSEFERDLAENSAKFDKLTWGQEIRAQIVRMATRFFV